MGTKMGVRAQPAPKSWQGGCHDSRSELLKIFFYKTAVVTIYRGESTQQAWQRHLAEHPEDAYVDIRIFNCESVVP